MKTQKITINLLLILLFFSTFYSVSAQNTEIKPGLVLPTMTTTQRTGLASPTNGMLVFDSNTQSYWYRQNGQWVELNGSSTNYWTLQGINGNEIKNTNSGGFWSQNPVGLVETDNDISRPPTAPVNGYGTRLMWIPSRSAFRAGTISYEALDLFAWDAPNIGIFSFATGLNTKASGHSSSALGRGSHATGLYSVALGNASRASGGSSTAMGSGSQASGFASTAMGNNSQASGFISTAMGYLTNANGDYSLATGHTTTASGDYSLATGHTTTASGNYSLATGRTTTASGDYTTAMGRLISTNGHVGSFAIGDSDPLGQGLTSVGTDDQLVARFKNGYYLMTSGDNFATRTGVQISNGQTAWSAISDSTRKENFLAADGESFLKKLRSLKLGSWNYKVNNTNPERFYGPMAQEIFAAFGKDKLGTIGNDTTVSTLNMDGLLFIFAQTLEKRTQSLQEENNNLKRQLAELQNSDFSALMNRLEKLEAVLNQKEKIEILGK